MPKVSVVIPVYNVEQYIERCLHSLFSQTLDDIEYIFVDDSSIDSSVKIINKALELYPYRKVLTKILHHSNNFGVGAARTTGIKAATGDYIIHCDPDDYIEVNMYEKLYSHAIETDADVVACYYWKEQQSQKDVVRINYSPTPQECLENLYKEKHHCGYLWDKLVRRKLMTCYEIIPHERYNYAEDLYCVVKILYYAHSLSVVDQPLYHYCRREGSTTDSPRNEYYWIIRKEVIDRVCDFLGNEKRYETACSYMRFYVKMEYRSVFIGKEKEWFELYRESHDKIFKYTGMPLKVRILWWFALRNYFTYKIVKALVKGI